MSKTIDNIKSKWNALRTNVKTIDIVSAFLVGLVVATALMTLF